MTKAVRLRPGDVANCGAYGENELSGRTVVGVIRSRFVVDKQGRIAKAMSNVPAAGHVTAPRRELGLD